MIPCQAHCPHYAPGCHKACARWRARRECLRRENKRKKDYLKSHDELCRLVIRQCRALDPVHPAY